MVLETDSKHKVGVCRLEVACQLRYFTTPPPPFYEFLFADLLDICAFGHHSVVKYSINIKKNLKHKFFVRKQPSPLETFPKIHSYWNTEPFVRPQVKSTI